MTTGPVVHPAVHYGNSTQAQKEFIRAKIDQSLAACQSCLVDALLERSTHDSGDFADEFSYDNVANFWRYVCPNCGGTVSRELETVELCACCDRLAKNCECDPDDKDIHEEDGHTCDGCDLVYENLDKLDTEAEEIYEWWLIADNWTKDALLEAGECVLETDYGDWWGRTCTGQAIILDPTFWNIFQEGVLLHKE